MQPTPVLSLGSDLRSPSLSSQPPPAPAGEQRSCSGWCVLLGTDPLCGNLSALPSAPLWLRSPPWLRSFPPLPPAVSAHEGASSCVETFPPSRLPPTGAGPVPILCLYFFFFLLPYPGTWVVSCLLGGLRSSASVQWVFCRSSSMCRCISDVSVGRKVISVSYSSAALKLLPCWCLKRFMVLRLDSVMQPGNQHKPASTSSPATWRQCHLAE